VGIARTDLPSWGCTWLVVLIGFFSHIFPQTPWSKVKDTCWSAFTRELVITNEAILGDISPRMQHHDAKRTSAAHQ
jgi:hypothetical protein